MLSKLNLNNETKNVDIDLEINEGPRVYVNEINIAGNTRTVDKVIRREFSLTEGDAYNKFAIIILKTQLKRLISFQK